MSQGRFEAPGPAVRLASCRVVVLAKAPVPGRVKTRLAASIGHAAATALARRLLDHTLSECLATGIGPVRLCGDPDGSDAAFGDWARDARLEHRAQARGDLGDRMAHALMEAARDPLPGCADLPAGVLLVGTDAPALDAGRLRAAAGRLARASVVFVPAADGGYALVGLAVHRAGAPQGLERWMQPLFSGIPWSTPQVMARTRMQLSAAGLDWAEEPALHDIDTADDLVHLPPALRPGSD